MVYHNFVNKFILPCLKSIQDHVSNEKFVCVFDNQSSHKETYKVADYCKNRDDFSYIRVDDQNENGGLTGAWNQGVDLCIQNDCDRIFVINDDVLINDTWSFFSEAVVDDGVIYGPVTNNPGHAWVDKKRRWIFGRWLYKSGKKQLASKNKSRNEDLEQVGFVNGFCFGCTTQTFIENRYDKAHYFDPRFPFGGNETEFQLRLFNLVPTDDNKENKRRLAALEAHKRAFIVPRCFVYHYKNHAWKKGGGANYSQQEFD